MVLQFVETKTCGAESSQYPPVVAGLECLPLLLVLPVVVTFQVWDLERPFLEIWVALEV